MKANMRCFNIHEPNEKLKSNPPNIVVKLITLVAPGAKDVMRVKGEKKLTNKFYRSQISKRSFSLKFNFFISHKKARLGVM